MQSHVLIYSTDTYAEQGSPPPKQRPGGVVGVALADVAGEHGFARIVSLGAERIHEGVDISTSNAPLNSDRGRLLWPATYEKSRSADFYSSILADFDTETRRFTMKPEAIEGFRRIAFG